MAECLATRLSAQEEQIRLLTAEISSLRDGLSNGFDVSGAAGPVSPGLESLRTENEKLRYRLLHLRRGLQEELRLEQAGSCRRQEAGKSCKAPEKNSNKAEHINNNKAENKVEYCWHSSSSSSSRRSSSSAP